MKRPRLIKPDFKIESDVPTPPPGLASWLNWPFANMKVGDSFLVGEDVRLTARCRGAASYFCRRNEGTKFSIRKTPEGFRCWRVK